MRIGIIGLLHESNTFISEPTTLDKFREDVLVSREAVRERMGSTHHEVAGFFAGVDAAGLEAVPLFAGRTMPFGTITADTYEQLMQLLFAEVEAAGKLDGYLVAPHGATVSEVHRDADGYWLDRLRQQVGANVPIISTIDPHANLSARMINACDATIAYRTNPHLDQKQRGLEAAALMARTVRGEVRPTQAAEFPPLQMSIESQHTAEAPCLPLYEHAEEIRGRDGVLSVSIVLGFPYADVEEMGSSVVVVTNDDPQLAKSLAGELATDMWDRRHDFLGEFIDVETALDRAAELKGPICLLDMGDNVGGGSPGDSTHLLGAMHRRKLPRTFGCIFDPEAAAQAQAAGVGASVELSVGAKTDDLHGEPIKANFVVRGLYDGKFHEPEVRHGGFTDADQGLTAIIETSAGLTLMLSSRRMPPYSLHQLTSCGLDPSTFHALVAKGVNLPIAAYRDVCPDFIRVNTPGVTTADMRNLDFQHRRRPMLPFEPDTAWNR